MVTLANPLDYHTFVWGDLARQTEAFAAMFAGDYALNLLVLDFPRGDRCDPVDWMTVDGLEAWTNGCKGDGRAHRDRCDTWARTCLRLSPSA